MKYDVTKLYKQMETNFTIYNKTYGIPMATEIF